MLRLTCRPFVLRDGELEEAAPAPAGEERRLLVVLRDRLHEGVTVADVGETLLRDGTIRAFLRGARAELVDADGALEPAELERLAAYFLRAGAAAAELRDGESGARCAGLLEIDLPMAVPVAKE